MPYKISFPTHVTSSLDTDGCCFRLALLRIFNLRQPQSFQRDLDFGGAFAESLYLARKGYYIEQLSQDEAEEKAFDYVDETFAPYFHKAMALRAKLGKEPEKVKTPERLNALLEKYWRKYAFSKEEIAPFLLNDSISAEQALHIPLLEGVTLSIKPDMIAVDRDHSTALDEKTVGNYARETNWPEYVYMLRPQFLLYAKGINYLIEKGELEIPTLAAFEVRRGIITTSISAAKDFCQTIKYLLAPRLYETYFQDFKLNIAEKLRRFEEFGKAYDIETLTSSDVIGLAQDVIERFFPKNYHECYMYGRPCELIEHCSVGRSLKVLGFKPSEINTVTKEVEFFD